MAVYEIELACDQHEGGQFAEWLRAQGHTVTIGGRTTGTISGMDQTGATAELNELWERYSGEVVNEETIAIRVAADP